MAQVLGVSLSGPRSYGGELRQFPFVNPDGAKDIGADEIDRAVSVLWRTWGIGLGIVTVLAVVHAVF